MEVKIELREGNGWHWTLLADAAGRRCEVAGNPPSIGFDDPAAAERDALQTMELISYWLPRRRFHELPERYQRRLKDRHMKITVVPEP